MSSSTAGKLWGRKYQVLVVMSDGSTALDVSNSGFEPEALRVQFRIEQIGYQAFYYGEITIYNLTPDTEQQIINEGAKVIVNAGYQGDGPYGKIWEGYVFQPMREREGVVDYKLTLNCVNQSKILDHNLVRFTCNTGQDPRTQIQNIAKQARYEIEVGKITDKLENSETKLPRGKTYFGEPKKYFRELADHTNSQWWVGENKVQYSRFDDPPTGETLTYTPESGLIGTPQQIDYGCAFRVLLDPRLQILNPPMDVKLDMALIRQQKARIGQLTSILDQDGRYRVAGVTHTGDTRGNEWYTDVVGVSWSGGKTIAAMVAGFGTQPSVNIPDFLQVPERSGK